MNNYTIPYCRSFRVKKDAVITLILERGGECFAAHNTVSGPVLGQAQFSATFCSAFIFRATNESE